MKLRAVLIPAVILAIALALVLVISKRWNGMRSTAGLQKTDDAYVHANIVPLSTRVSDTLRTLNVSDFEQVQAGQLLAQLDDTDYKADVTRAQAQLAASQASLADNQVQKQVQSARIAEVQKQVDEAVGTAGAAAANVHAAEAQVERADQERHRQEVLFADRATTKQTLERAVADDEQQHSSLDSAHSDLAKAEAAVMQARHSVTEAQRDLQLLVSKDRDFTASIAQQRASVKAALVQLGYTRIYAPVNGTVGERTVFPGQLVSPGMDVISLVEGDLWIQANFEETQLGDMRNGDGVDIRIDAVPGSVFHGKVLQVAPASGSETALLPADNATGNFTKVVQRIPVKISIDSGSEALGRLRPGLSAAVSVHTSGGHSR